MLPLYVTVMSHTDLAGKVLVTGAAGFIGSHLCRRLVANRVQVRALDNLSTGTEANIADIMHNELFEFTLGDVLEQKQVESQLDGCMAVFHLAANPEVRAALSDGEIDFEQNLRSTHERRPGVALSFSLQHQLSMEMPRNCPRRRTTDLSCRSRCTGRPSWVARL